MRRLALLLSCVALGLTGLSYYSGSRIERDFDQAVARLTQRPDFPGEIKTTYRRGLFTSTAESELRWASGTGPALEMVHRIAHGPIPWSGLRHGARPGDTWIESELRLGAGTHPALAAVFAAIPPLQILTIADRDGGMSRFHWPAFEGNSPEVGKLSIAELRGEVDFGGPRQEAVGSLAWDGMKIESPLFSFEMAAMSGEFAYENITTPAIYGQSSFSLESIGALAGGRSVADLHALRWTERRAVEDGKMFLHSTLAVESLSVMGFALRDASLDTRFENLDISVWERVREIAKTLAKASRGTTLAASNGAPIPNGAQALELFQAFVAADPSFALELRALVNGERLSAGTHARFDSGAGAAGLDPEALLRALDAELALQVPARLLDAWIDGPRGGKAAQLRALRDQGFLRRGPANLYETQLRVRRGELFVNGVPYPALQSFGPGARRRH